jgi:CRP-like cAMP-binding protein
MPILSSLKEEAEGLYIKGKWKKALKIFLDIHEEDPGDIRVTTKIGDIYLKLNEKNDAIQFYKKVTESYISKGDLVKAIAICKKILSVDPRIQGVKNFIEKLSQARTTRTININQQLSKKSWDKEPKKLVDTKLLEAPPEINPPSDHSQVAREVMAILDNDPASDEIEATLVEAVADGDEMSNPPWPFFSSLKPDEFSAVFDKLCLRSLGANSIICNIGEKADSFFIISSGQAKVTIYNDQRQEMTIGKLTEGHFFGEFALLHNNRRQANVIAETDIEILEFSRLDIARVCQQHPRVFDVLFQSYKARLMNNILYCSPIFQHLSEEEKEEINNGCRLIEFPKDEVIISKDETDTEVFFIVEGQVEIQLVRKGMVIKIAELRQGEFFGEISGFVQQKRIAQVKSITALKLFCVESSLLSRIVNRNTKVANMLNQIIYDRVNETYQIVKTYREMEKFGPMFVPDM